MKIFGIGLSRTGTLTLTAALRILNISSFHFPTSLNQINQYQSSTDTPISLGYKFLDLYYTESKFILTIREKEAWLNSCENFFKTVYEYNKNIKSINIFIKKLHNSLYDCDYYDRTAFSIAYDKHLIDAQKYFKDRPNDFLILNICAGDGWEKLCPFLNKEIPNVPFPHEHKAKYTNYGNK